jgi:hypothetical protein
MTDGTPISGLGPHHGRRQQETSPFRVRRTVGFSLNNAPGLENRWTRLSIASPSSTYSRHRVAASGLAADPTTASESALPSTIRPDAPGWRSHGGAASGHLAPLPHNPATPHPARPRRPLQPVHRSPVPWRLGEAERPSGPWFCAYYSGRGSGTWVRRCVSRPWLGDVRGWDDALWDARPRLLLPATAKMLRIDTLVARNHIRSPGRLLACWIHDTS